jgi:protease I
MKKVLFVIAPGNFRDEELLIPKETMEKNGIETEIVSCKEGEFTGMLGAKTYAKDIKTINLNEYDVIIFVGGSGIAEHKTYEIPEFLNAAKEFKDKIIGAICLGPLVPAFAGILKNKKITMWPSDRFIDMIKDKVKEIDLEKGVIKDGNVVTAAGPTYAEDFGIELLNLIKEN